MNVRNDRAITARPCTTRDEMKAAGAAISHYFGARPDDAWVDRWLRFFDLERMHAAFDGKAIVGGAGAFDLSLTIPGGIVPAAGVTVVGVLPTHRRRGVLTSLMRAQLDDVRRRGESIACLWASEETIYRRFGYGPAVLSMEMTIARERTAFHVASPLNAVARRLGRDEALALLPSIYDRVRERTPGMHSRPRGWWPDRRMLDSPDRRNGGGELDHVVVEIDGVPSAYALYRMHASWDKGVSSGHVDVLEAVATTPEATRALWRVLLDIDWTSEIRAMDLAIDSPLRHLLLEPRRAAFRVYDSLWVRLVDVGAALSARSYVEGAGSVVLELRDAFCAWNAGRWEVGAGVVRKTEAAPDIALDVSDLASVYLGGHTFRDLAAGARIEARTEGSLRRADAVFRTEGAPWNPEVF